MLMHAKFLNLGQETFIFSNSHPLGKGEGWMSYSFNQTGTAGFYISLINEGGKADGESGHLS